MDNVRDTRRILCLCFTLLSSSSRPSEELAQWEWRSPRWACSYSSAGRTCSGLLWAGVTFPWAVLKGAAVALPAGAFGFVGGTLLIPAALARCIGCLAVLAVRSKTLTLQKRLAWLAVCVVSAALWVPSSLVLVIFTAAGSVVAGFVVAFNSTYIATFYRTADPQEDPMNFWLPRGFAGRLFFGFLETFEYEVDVAEWFINYYMEYLEPAVLHCADPYTCKNPRRVFRGGKMTVATQKTNEGVGDRTMTSRIEIGQALVSASAPNALFVDQDGLELDDIHLCGSPGKVSLAVPGLSAYGDSRLTVDSYKGCYSNPLASSHGAEHLSHKQVLTPDRDPDTLSEQPVSEWVLIHEDAARQYMQMSGDDSRLMGNLSMSMSHCPPHSAPGELSMAAASEADLSVAVDATGGQRGHGEWGICRSKTFSPCDARLGTVRRPCGALSAALECPAPSPRVDGFSNECSCPAQLSPGQLIVTVFYDQTPAGGKNALGTFAPKVWRFCPNAACISSRPVGSDLPPAPAVFPIDRLARASVVEQIQLEKAGIRTQCT